MTADKSEATVGQLLSALASDTGSLVRQELHLAATEMTEKANSTARNLGLVVAGGALLHVACIALLAGVMASLEPMLPLHLSAAIVGGCFALVGIVLLQMGRTALRQLDPRPRTALNAMDPTGV